MNVIIPDASVAAKWVLPAQGEPFKDKALLLQHRYQRGELRLLVPDLFWAELANILWKAVRQGRRSQADARAGLVLVESLNLPTISCRTVLQQAFNIATAFNRSAYDGLYVAVAIEANGQLVTADERLANALVSHCPVKWLGAL